MKKISTILFLLFITGIFCAFQYVPACTGCKNLHVTEKDGVYIFHIPYSGNYTVKPYVSEKLVLNEKVFKETDAQLVVNAGYFDPKNQKTTSYVVLDNVLALDPKDNENLMQNKSLSSNMRKILNRTEFRILDCDGIVRYDIASHNAKAPYKCTIKHSVQAGPMVYPSLRLKEEYFVTQDGSTVTRDSISALKKCARTVIGMKDNDLYLIIATTKHPMTLNEISELCRDLRLDKAMNFDGGGSTSVDFKGTNSPDFKNLHIVSEKDQSARKLKSFLVINQAQ